MIGGTSMAGGVSACSAVRPSMATTRLCALRDYPDFQACSPSFLILPDAIGRSSRRGRLREVGHVVLIRCIADPVRSWHHGIWSILILCLVAGPLWPIWLGNRPAARAMAER